MKKMLVMVAAALMSVTALAQYGIDGACVTPCADTTPSYYSAYIFEIQAANNVNEAAAYINANGISGNEAKVIAYWTAANGYEDNWGQILFCDPSRFDDSSLFSGSSFIDGINREYSGAWDKAWLAVIYNDGNSQAKFKVVTNTDDSSFFFDDEYNASTSWSDYNHISDPTSTPEPTSGLLLLLGMAGLALKRRG